MSISCSEEADSYVEISEGLVSAAPFKCLECRQEIPAFVPFYMVRCWRPANDGDWEGGLSEDEDEVTESEKPCCEECGDLAISFLDLGYCWDYGSLRNDIREAAEI
jgi:hypothetical protein